MITAIEMLIACDDKKKRKYFNIYFQSASKIHTLYPPLIKLVHSHIAVCFVYINLKLLINMTFNY